LKALILGKYAGSINHNLLIDTRAPIEFEQGAFPQSQNLILMSDDEREKIGACYKNKGQAKATNNGLYLITHCA
jgi:tRNA 2-selenouridine synthase